MGGPAKIHALSLAGSAILALCLRVALGPQRSPHARPHRHFVAESFSRRGEPDAAAAVLEVVVDTNGSGTRTFSDADDDGIVDFNETIGGCSKPALA